MKQYTPSHYWEHRLQKNFDLTGVGHGGLGPHYNAYLYQRRLETLSAGLARIKQPLAGMRILEVGCGTGFYTNFFTQHNVSKYYGIDISKTSAKKLKQRHPLFHFICADITESTPIYAENLFDIVFAADVLFHIVADERWERALDTMASHLTSGGWLIISDIFPTQTVQTAAHVRLRSLDDYHQILQKHYFSTFHIEPIFTILQPPPTTSHLIWWNAYALIWRFEQRLIKNTFLDRTLPYLLGWLDRNLFSPYYGTKVPNSKWLFARKA